MIFNPFSIQRQQVEPLRTVYADECQQCGVCCVYHCSKPFQIPAPKLPPVFAMFDVPQKLIQIGPNGYYGNRYIRITKIKNDREFTGGQDMSKCAALSGILRHSVECSIYDERPSACRNYDPGSPACIAARRWAGMDMPDDFLGHS